MSEEQFDDWFRRMLPVVRRSVSVLVRGGDLDDVCAEAFARAYGRWPRVSRLAHRDAWLLRVAINVALDLVGRKPAPIGPLPFAEDTSRVAGRVDIGRTLRALPRRQRQVVSLRYLADMPERDVAQVLGMSVNTVKRHTARALASLRGDLRSMWEEAIDAD